MPSSIRFVRSAKGAPVLGPSNAPVALETCGMRGGARGPPRLTGSRALITNLKHGSGRTRGRAPRGACSGRNGGHRSSPNGGRLRERRAHQHEWNGAFPSARPALGGAARGRGGARGGQARFGAEQVAPAGPAPSADKGGRDGCVIRGVEAGPSQACSHWERPRRALSHKKPAGGPARAPAVWVDFRLLQRGTANARRPLNQPQTSRARAGALTGARPRRACQRRAAAPRRRKVAAGGRAQSLRALLTLPSMLLSGEPAAEPPPPPPPRP